MTIEYEQPRNKYEKKYNVENYVTEKLEGSSIIHNIIIDGLLNYSTFVEDKSHKVFIKDIIKTIGTSFWRYQSYVINAQYKENKLITLIELKDDATLEHNYSYTGQLKNGKDVTGYIAIFPNNKNYSIAVSFLDGNGIIDKDKIELLSDDSNSEYLVYQIIQATQEMYNTNMEPNIAAKYYYNSSIEQIAGSISYHAIVAKILIEKNIDDPNLLRHVEIANISKNDDDSIILNRKY